jgi:hypothetical protein
MSPKFVVSPSASGISGDRLIAFKGASMWRDDHLSVLAQRAACVTAALLCAPTLAWAEWTPGLSDRWQWQLSGPINTAYDALVYDIDLFDTPDSTIVALHAQGRYVVCYFSAGSAENWRPDYAQFIPSELGRPLDGWPGEKWIDTRSANVRAIMRARLDLAQSRGCDGVEPDNVDAYSNGSGFPLTSATQLDYNRFLSVEARNRGLKVGLKNDVQQVAELAPSFDFAVNEQCHQYRECGAYAAFTLAGKPVFNAEYKRKYVSSPSARAQLCAKAKEANLRTLILPLNLDDAYRYSCDEEQ